MLRTGNRREKVLFPSSIESYVSANDPVRAYDLIVDSLDFEKLNLVVDFDKQGNPSYSPIAMLKLLIYAYSYGWRSSRKIERATHHNISFIWLLGGLKPSYRTIARFRKDNLDALTNSLKQVTRMCVALNLIEGNVFYQDGSKIRGNSSINQTKSKKTLEKRLEQIDKDIDNFLKNVESIDNLEENQASLIELPVDLNSLEKEIKDVKKKLNESKKKSKNQMMKSRIISN